MHKYIIATIKDWNINQYNKSIYKKSKNWFLITDTEKLTIGYVNSIKPKYIFFPHWSKKVDSKIINNYECVCFHETDVPYGRGGSPIQNLIIRNHKKTKITALKMTDKIDAGWRYGLNFNKDDKVDPRLQPYHQLTNKLKNTDKTA